MTQKEVENVDCSFKLTVFKGSGGNRNRVQKQANNNNKNPQ